MKIILQIIFSVLICIDAFAGTHADSFVYHVADHHSINGELLLTKVEVYAKRDTVIDIGYAVFAPWYKSYQSMDGKSFITKQANRAYFSNLKVSFTVGRNHTIYVGLDYTGCTEELKKIKFKSELDNLIEGTGAALLYTFSEYSPGSFTGVILSVKGYIGEPTSFEREYTIEKLSPKWKLKKF